jgi:hypothetical protein
MLTVMLRQKNGLLYAAREGGQTRLETQNMQPRALTNACDVNEARLIVARY